MFYLHIIFLFCSCNHFAYTKMVPCKRVQNTSPTYFTASKKVIKISAEPKPLERYLHFIFDSLNGDLIRTKRRKDETH